MASSPACPCPKAHPAPVARLGTREGLLIPPCLPSSIIPRWGQFPIWDQDPWGHPFLCLGAPGLPRAAPGPSLGFPPLSFMCHKPQSTDPP